MRSRAGWLWLSAGALAALLLLWRTAIPAASARTYAFSAYYTAARLALQGRAGVQLCTEWFFAQQRALGFGDRADFFCPNPPTTALLMLPVAWLPPPAARAAWVALDVAMAAMIVAIGWRIIVGQRKFSAQAQIDQPRVLNHQDAKAPRFCVFVPWRLGGESTPSYARYAALAAIVLALFRPLHADWQTNQVYTLIGLLYALWLYGYLAECDLLCGAALAVLALAKLSGWPLWLLLAARRWRSLAWAAGSGLAGLLLSLPFFGVAFWRLYLVDQLWAIASDPSSAAPANQTLMSLLRQCFAYAPPWSPAPLLDAPWLAAALWWALALALLAATLRVAARRAPIVAPLAIMCLVVPLQPAGEEYHYTPLLLAVIVALAAWRGEMYRVAALAVVLLLFALPAYFVDTAALAGWPRALAAYPRMYAALTLWGLIMTSSGGIIPRFRRPAFRLRHRSGTIASVSSATLLIDDRHIATDMRKGQRRSPPPIGVFRRQA